MAGVGTARIWDAGSGRLLATLRQGTISTVQFSPNGKRVVTSSDDQTARIWEADGGGLVAILRGHEGFLFGAKYSRDSQRIVTAAGDTTARVWTILPQTADVPPTWLPDFLHYLGQTRLDSNGELESIPVADSIVFRDRLRQIVNESGTQDTPYLRVLRRFVHE